MGKSKVKEKGPCKACLQAEIDIERLELERDEARQQLSNQAVYIKRQEERITEWHAAAENACQQLAEARAEIASLNARWDNLFEKEAAAAGGVE